MTVLYELNELMSQWCYSFKPLGIKETIEEFVKEEFPSGSGINRGCMINLEKSNMKEVHIYFDYEHMNSEGFNTCITEHEAILSATFGGFSIEFPSKDEYSKLYDEEEELAEKLFDKYVAEHNEEPIDNEHLEGEENYHFLPEPDEFYEEMEYRFFDALIED